MKIVNRIILVLFKINWKFIFQCDEIDFNFHTHKKKINRDINNLGYKTV